MWVSCKKTCRRRERRNETTKQKKKKKRDSSVYRQTITNQYFLRSISDCARRWPHPRRRTKQQQDIEGDSDMYVYIYKKRERASAKIFARRLRMKRKERWFYHLPVSFCYFLPRKKVRTSSLYWLGIDGLICSLFQIFIHCPFDHKRW